MTGHLEHAFICRSGPALRDVPTSGRWQLNLLLPLASLRSSSGTRQPPFGLHLPCPLSLTELLATSQQPSGENWQTIANLDGFSGTSRWLRPGQALTRDA